MSEVLNTHEGFTRMLFVDALIGVGFPELQVGIDAERGGLAVHTGLDAALPTFMWIPEKLMGLSVDTLQELYMAIKTHEVTHAD